MGSSTDHRAKADHNQLMLEALEIDRFPDWAATVAFYKAVHLVEMLFAARDNCHSQNHNERNARLRRNYRDIWHHFRAMLNFSVLARYEMRRIDPNKVRDKIINDRLSAIESLVDNKLAA